MSTIKELEGKIDKLIVSDEKHNDMTNKIAQSVRTQNLVIGFIFTVGGILMFTLSQLIPLFLEIIKMD